MQSQITERWQTTIRFGVDGSGQSHHQPDADRTALRSVRIRAPNYLGNVVTLTGANGYSVTGQAILDYGGIYPSLYDTSTKRQTGSGRSDTAHCRTWLDLSGGATARTRRRFRPCFGRLAVGRRRTTNGGVFVEARTTLHRVFVNCRHRLRPQRDVQVCGDSARLGRALSARSVVQGRRSATPS